MRKLILNYSVYVIYFLGMGLVSSGIVLMPFNSIRYSIILTIGLSLFLTGAIITEFVINKNTLKPHALLKLIFVSLTLAIGIGMISGGISHFKETPTYVSYLIPLGIVISFISFSIKNNYKLPTKKRILLFLVVITLAFSLHLALSYMANFVSTPGGDIFAPMNDMH